MLNHEHWHRGQRVVAGALLIIGLALVWVAVTPHGALRCLHCFLEQRWVEGTPADRRLSQVGSSVAADEGSSDGPLLRSLKDDLPPGVAFTGNPLSEVALPAGWESPQVDLFPRSLPCDHDRDRFYDSSELASLGPRAPPRIITS